jgi:hypothetical protein
MRNTPSRWAPFLGKIARPLQLTDPGTRDAAVAVSLFSACKECPDSERYLQPRGNLASKEGVEQLSRAAVFMGGESESANCRS